MDLKFKADWFLARNPLGLVPILELNENVVYESEVCGDLLEELYPQNPLYPKDPFEKAQHKQLMSIFGKVRPKKGPVDCSILSLCYKPESVVAFFSSDLFLIIFTGINVPVFGYY